MSEELYDIDNFIQALETFFYVVIALLPSLAVFEMVGLLSILS